MSFTNPIWLWAMMGLSIPIGIHLLSRKEGKVISMGSVRFLTESPTAQFRHIRLNEIVLLFLRCLLLTIIVFLLAGLKIDTLNKKKEKWLVLENGVQNSEWKTFIDSLSSAGFEKHLLSENFPVFTETIDSSTTVNYWSLVNNLKQVDLDSAVIISYNLATNFKGERIPLPPKFRWITTEPAEKQFIAAAVQSENDSLWIRTGMSSTTTTEFETSKANDLTVEDSVLRTNADTTVISIFLDPEYEYDKKVIVAALRAIETSSPHQFKISTSPTSNFKHPRSGWILWLSPKKMPELDLPAMLTKNGLDKNLALIETGAKASLHDSTIRATDRIITKQLSQENALAENITLTLADIFQSGTKQNVSIDNRTIPYELAWSKLDTNGNGNSTMANDDLIVKILIYLLILTLLVERALAFNKNQ